MPKYEVVITNNQSYSATIEVEADDEDAAAAKAKQIAEDDSSKDVREVSWTLEDNDFEVDDVNELDDDENDGKE